MIKIENDNKEGRGKLQWEKKQEVAETKIKRVKECKALNCRYLQVKYDEQSVKYCTVLSLPKIFIQQKGVCDFLIFVGGR